MQIPDLLQQLDHLQDKNEKQADQYLSEIQKFLKTNSGRKWTPEHEAIFKLLQKRIIETTYYKRLFVAVAILMVLVGLFIGARWLFSWEDYLTDKALMEMANSSTLPIILEQMDTSKNFLTVKFATNFQDIQESKRDQLIQLVKEIPTIGRHYSLGENAPLKSALLPSENKLLLIEPSNNTPLGKIDLKESSGAIWPATGINALMARQQFRLGDPIQFRKDDQPIPFYLAVMAMEEDKWEVRFSENGVIWSKSYFLNKTNRGDIEAPPYLVYETGWNGVHFVALGIGKYGEENGERYAWQIKSFVKSIRFQN